MRRLGILALLALLSAGGLLAIPAPAPDPRVPPSCKPTAPIDLEAQIVGDPSGGFGVSARAAATNGAEVELEILLPDGVTHVAGVRKLKARRCDARVDLVAKDRSRREIVVRATLTQGKAKLVKIVPLVIFDGPPPPRPGKPGRDAAGEAIQVLTP